jgi:FlaA1/EpsC-like NDP-sugar epimerase
MIYVLNKLAASILGLPRSVKRVFALSIDAGLCVLTVWLAFYLRLGLFIPFSEPLFWPVIASVALALPLFILAGLYRTIFRYSGMPAMMAVVRTILIYGFIFSIIFSFYGIEGVPRTVGLIQPVLFLLFVGASRAVARTWLGGFYHQQLRKVSIPRVLIYGAGSAGRQLASAVLNGHEMHVVGFLDDDKRLYDHFLNGLPIYNPADLDKILTNIPVTDVLLALPSVTRNRRNEIISAIRHHKVKVRTLPGLGDIVTGKVCLSDIHDLDIDDLLGRERVAPNHNFLVKNIANKVVLVTGAGGSIGGELCRQILSMEPAKLLLIEQSEFALYTIYHELEKKLSSQKTILVPLIASVRDEERMREIMSAWSPDTVYHAAAYKHVPLVEHNPAEGIKNNVFGTLCVAQAAVANGVANFVLISTDKAVRPTNVMGASKRLAEMVLQALAEDNLNNKNQTKIKFAMVRFGNVLGSSGSVVPKFRQQIRDGGPVTLTHAEITRYFMTIPEAAQLVIQAGAMSKGGDVFILDMGEPIKIIDLANRMIELSGLSVRDEKHPNGDIEIKITGLRPGEKLFEELLIGDNPKPTPHPRIMRADEDFISWVELEKNLKNLQKVLKFNDVSAIRLVMTKLVSGFTPSEDIVDWVHMELEADAERLE